MARNKSTIKYPRRARFTIADCIACNARLNAQTVRSLLREEIYAGTVNIVGKAESTGRGRPAFVLARV